MLMTVHLRYLFLWVFVARCFAAQKHVIKDNPMEALYDASKAGNKQAIWMALDNGAEINKQDLGGVTALMHAAFEGQAAASEELIEQGAKVNMQNVDGTTALMIAVEKGAAKTVQVLLKHKADVNIIDVNGATALMRAAFVVYDGALDTLQALLDAGATEHLDTHAKQGDNPILAAAWNTNWPALAILVKAGADVNAVDSVRGHTALMAACNHAHAPTVQILLRNGADVATISPDDKSALDLLLASKANAKAVADARGTEFDDTDYNTALSNLRDHDAKTSLQYIYHRFRFYGFCAVIGLAVFALLCWMVCTQAGPTPPPSAPATGKQEAPQEPGSDSTDATGPSKDTADTGLRRRQVQE